MTTIEEFMDTIHDEEKHAKFQMIIDWIHNEFPELGFKIAWKQPMFTHHETFIIGLSVSKKHIAIAPEVKGIQVFATQITNAGYSFGSNIFRIEWDVAINFELLRNIIHFNIEDKEQCTTFWRK